MVLPRRRIWLWSCSLLAVRSIIHRFLGEPHSGLQSGYALPLRPLFDFAPLQGAPKPERPRLSLPVGQFG